MKKISILILALVLIIILAFTIFTLLNDKNKITTSNQNDINEEVSVSSTNTSKNESRIKLTFNNEEVYVKLNNSKASNDFVSMLPITLDFEDYNNTEKIAYLPRNLTTKDEIDGYTPEIGDFSYYAPWGNLSLFYKEFRYSNSLIKLGEFESGIEKIQNLNEDFTMTIEIVN